MITLSALLIGFAIGYIIHEALQSGYNGELKKRSIRYYDECRLYRARLHILCHKYGEDAFRHEADIAKALEKENI
jgi:hypothetical protein